MPSFIRRHLLFFPWLSRARRRPATEIVIVSLQTIDLVFFSFKNRIARVLYADRLPCLTVHTCSQSNKYTRLLINRQTHRPPSPFPCGTHARTHRPGTSPSTNDSSITVGPPISIVSGPGGRSPCSVHRSRLDIPVVSVVFRIDAYGFLIEPTFVVVRVFRARPTLTRTGHIRARLPPLPPPKKKRSTDFTWRLRGCRVITVCSKKDKCTKRKCTNGYATAVRQRRRRDSTVKTLSGRDKRNGRYAVMARRRLQQANGLYTRYNYAGRTNQLRKQPNPVSE